MAGCVLLAMILLQTDVHVHFAISLYRSSFRLSLTHYNVVRQHALYIFFKTVELNFVL